MGNFHCVQSNCAKVAYSEYSSPVVRWRYEEEDWSEAVGDNFTLETVQSEIPPGKYVFWQAEVNWKERFGDGVLTRNFSVHNLRFGSHNHANIPQGTPLFDQAHPSSTRLQVPYEYIDSEGVNRQVSYNLRISSGYVPISWVFYGICLVENPAAQNCSEGEPPPTKCKFTVYLKQQEVLVLTGDECPEVEVIPPRLSDVKKEITIEKLPYLERVEVVPWAYQNISGLANPDGGGLFGVRASIPDECLNVYKNTTVTLIPQSQSIPTPTNTPQAQYGYITQICSESGSPPPEYEVICGCSCEDCPDGTCAVECDGQICCYDTTTGQAIKSIPVEDYCGR